MRDKLKAIWNILTSEYFILLTYNEDEDHINIKVKYKKHHKQRPIINDMIETIWRYLYFKDN